MLNHHERAEMEKIDLSRDIVACREEDAGSSPSGPSSDVEFKTDSTVDLPRTYGDNKIVLMVRDPGTIYAYWEIKSEVETSVRETIREKGLAPSKSVLRVYDVTQSGSDSNPKVVCDFELKGWVDNWYIHVGNPGRAWMAAVGILCSTGEFFSLARSNAVRTPADRMSDVCDEDWMCPEELYYRMFAAAGGDEAAGSSLELKELIGRHLKKKLFSGGLT